MQQCRVERPFGQHPLVLETGKLAKQAHGAVTVQYGGTIVLVAAVEGSPIPGRDFFPLTCDYREKTYAAGKFPGGFLKREGRPTTKETLTSRLIDRPIRPLFPPTYINEVQVMASTLSADRENDPDVLSIIGASAALHLSQIPFLQPTGAVRLGRINGAVRCLPDARRAGGERPRPDRRRHAQGHHHDRGLRPRDARGGHARRHPRMSPAHPRPN